jgi:COP9 signalosome complex subunit 4
MEGRLRELLSLQQRDKAPAYTALLQRSLKDENNSIGDICLLISTVVNEEQVGLVVARQVLDELSKLIPEIRRPREWKQELIQSVLRVLQPRLVSFEEWVSELRYLNLHDTLSTRQATALRYQLADMFEEEEEWSEAAKVLTGISLESSNRWAKPHSREAYAMTSHQCMVWTGKIPSLHSDCTFVIGRWRIGSGGDLL